MRKGLLSTIAVSLVGTGMATAQPPSYLPPGPPDMQIGRSSVIVGTPVLLPATPGSMPQMADPGMSGGSTGLRPGLDCLPDPSAVCCQKSRLYADAAYLVLWFQHSTPPPLIAVGPLAAAGAVGVPGTAILYGGTDTNFGAFSGARTTVGYWLDPQQTWGLEAGGLLTEQRIQNFVASHDGSPTNAVALGRVDFTAPGLALGPLVGAPGILRGSETVTETSRLWTADANAVMNWRDQGRMRIDVMAGFRYMDLEERLRVRDDTQSVLFPTTVISRTDDFSTRNQFYGGQVGSRTVLTYDRLSLTMVGKLAVGATHQVVDRNGDIQLAGTTSPGGYLVPAGSIGQDTTDRLSIMSETTLQVSYRLTRRLETFIGYELLYMSSVARPADQIFDTGSALGPLATGIHVTDFFAQGVQVGMAFRW